MKWILSGTDSMTTGGPEGSPDTVWRRPENSENVRIAGSGHLIPQEAPAALADEIHKFLADRHSRGKVTSRM